MNDSWGYNTPPEQQDVVDARYKKAARIASRRSLPADVQVTHSSRTFRLADGTTGPTQHTVRATHVDSDGLIKRDVGEITWAGNDGHVAWMGAPAHIVPHLLDRAHRVSQETGDAPPLYAEDLSVASHRLVRKYMPSQLPAEGVTVGGVPMLTPENFAKATEVVNSAHAEALAALPAEHHATINRAASDARSAVTNGRRNHTALHTLSDAERHGAYDDYQQHASNFHAASHRLANTVEKHGTHIPGAVQALRAVSGFMF